MSAEHVGWAFRQKGLAPTRKFVLVALADRCNKDTLRCDPTVSRLAEDTGLGERAVRQALTDLCEAGLLTRHRPRKKDGSYGHYRYSFPQLAVRVAAPPAAPGAGSPAAGDAAKPEVNLEPEELLAAAPQNGHRPKPTRAQRDEVWDTLTDIFGPALTRSAETLRGKHVASLAEAGATRDEIMRRAKAWPAHFDTATLTAAALEKHWDTLGRKPLRRTG